MSADRPELHPLLASLRARGPERIAAKIHAAAVYARTSTTDQESIPVQLDMCRQYAARLGLPVTCELSEQESGLDTERPEYRRLLEMARRGAFSHVIVFHSSRWGREPGEYLTAFHELARLGIEVHATGLGRIDPSTAWVHAGVNYMAARDISAHVLPTMIARAKQGYESGRARYGYRRTLSPGIREPHPDQFPIVQELFRRAAAGESIHSLTVWFNGASGLRKRANTITQMLAEPYYAGVYVWNRTRNSKIDGKYRKSKVEWTWATHPHPAVDAATFASIQQRLDRNRNVGQQRKAGAQYPLTGLLWCGACLRRMHGERVASAHYISYHCPYCGRSKSQRKVERALGRLLAGLPQDPASIAARRAQQADVSGREEEARRAGAVREAEKLRARLIRLTELYADGALSSADYQAARASTTAQLAALDASVAALAIPAASDAAPGKAMASVWGETTPLLAATLERATPAEANALYRTLFARVELEWERRVLRVRWVPGMDELAGAPLSEVDI